MEPSEFNQRLRNLVREAVDDGLHEQHILNQFDDVRSDIETLADSHYLPQNIQNEMLNYSREIHDIADRLEQQAEIEKSRFEAIEERLE